MVYGSAISSKGQVTIPIDIRRKFGFEKRVIFYEDDGKLLMRREPKMQDVWEILDRKDKPGRLSKREDMIAEILVEKDRLKRGH
jgi:AbrB family looped-hinge helix DNA binding protein